MCQTLSAQTHDLQRQSAGVGVVASVVLSGRRVVLSRGSVGARLFRRHSWRWRRQQVDWRARHLSPHLFGSDDTRRSQGDPFVGREPRRRVFLPAIEADHQPIRATEERQQTRRQSVLKLSEQPSERPQLPGFALGIRIFECPARGVQQRPRHAERGGDRHVVACLALDARDLARSGPDGLHVDHPRHRRSAVLVVSRIVVREPERLTSVPRARVPGLPLRPHPLISCRVRRANIRDYRGGRPAVLDERPEPFAS